MKAPSTSPGPMVMKKVSRNATEAEDLTSPAEVIEEPVHGEPVMVDEIPKNVDYKKLMADEAFMNEKLLIMVYPSMVEGDTARLISVGVNGRKQYIMAGKPTKVRRYHVAQLLKARPDFVTHRTDDPNDPRPNVMTKVSTSKYNFDVIEDTPKGRMWLAELKKQYVRT